MTWLQILLIAWLAGHIIIPPVLYYGYGFVTAAQRAEIDGKSPPHVVMVDKALSIPIILLDGAYNALWLSFLCLDPRPHYAFRMVTFKGVTFPFFELATERFSRYNEQPDAWRWHKFIAQTVAPFLDGKDPKGWHVRRPKTEGADL